MDELFAFDITPDEMYYTQGGYPTISYGEAPWWSASINRGIDTIGSIFSHSPYISPDDPRYRQQQSRTAYPQPQPSPQPDPSRNSGIQLSTQTLMLLVGGVLLFMLGSRRK